LKNFAAEGYNVDAQRVWAGQKPAAFSAHSTATPAGARLEFQWNHPGRTRQS